MRTPMRSKVLPSDPLHFPSPQTGTGHPDRGGVVFSSAPHFGASGHAAKGPRIAGSRVKTHWESPDPSRRTRIFACVLFLPSQARTPEVGASAPTFIIIQQDWAFAPEELSFSSHHPTQEVLR